MSDAVIFQSCGVVFCDVKGLTLSHEDRQRLSHPRCAGVILFARNYENKKQLKKLTAAIKKLKSPELLIAVDQEGGRVQRFREEFLKLPPAGWFGELYQQSTEQGIAAAQAGGWLMAAECLSVGVDFSFAPVLDLDFKRSDIIGNRAFYSTVDGVTALASAWVRGMHEAGMAAVGKHFPGHGYVCADSHLELPEDARFLEDLLTADLKVFSRLIKSGLEGMMPAHVLYSAIDSRPAGFSPYWLQQVLRQQMGFDGLIFSDDLSMAGAVSAGTPAQRAAAAIQAGCDILLVCNDPEAADEVLSSLMGLSTIGMNEQTIINRLSHIKAKRKISPEQLVSSAEWRSKTQLMVT